MQNEWNEWLNRKNDSSESQLVRKKFAKLKRFVRRIKNQDYDDNRAESGHARKLTLALIFEILLW